jgi:hypothetical protein
MHIGQPSTPGHFWPWKDLVVKLRARSGPRAFPRSVSCRLEFISIDSRVIVVGFWWALLVASMTHFGGHLSLDLRSRICGDLSSVNTSQRQGRMGIWPVRPQQTLHEQSKLAGSLKAYAAVQSVWQPSCCQCGGSAGSIEGFHCIVWTAPEFRLCTSKYFDSPYIATNLLFGDKVSVPL